MSLSLARKIGLLNESTSCQMAFINLNTWPLRRSTLWQNALITSQLPFLALCGDTSQIKITPERKFLPCFYPFGILLPSQFFFSFFFQSSHSAYRSSQASSRIGAAAADLHHSHSNARSKLHLRSTRQLTAMPDP